MKIYMDSGRDPKLGGLFWRFRAEDAETARFLQIYFPHVDLRAVRGPIAVGLARLAREFGVALVEEHNANDHVLAATGT